MSASDPILSSLLISFCFGWRALPLPPWGREIAGSIEFSTVLDDDAKSSLAFPLHPEAKM